MPSGLGRRVRFALYCAAVALLALVALGATLELGQLLNGLWTRFPAPLGGRGLALVVVLVTLGATGLVAVRGLPLRRALVLAFAVLIATRTGALLLVEPALVRDQAAYDSLARGVLEGECCFGVRPMGYPILLAAAYAVGLSGKVIGFVFALLAGPLLFALGKRLAGERAGVVAVYVYAIAPSLVLFSGVLMTETVYATILLAGVWAVSGPLSDARGALSGVLLGVSQYVRAASLFLAPALLLPLVMRRAWRQAAIFLAVLMLMLVPVVLATGGPSTSSLAGWTLLIGTNQQHDGRYNQDDAVIYASWGADRERRATQEALGRIVSDPLGFAALAVRKSHVMWTQEYYGVQFALADAGRPERDLAPARLLSQLAYAGVVVGAAVGAWRLRQWRTALVVVVLTIFVTVGAIHTLTEVQHRYHAYLVPLFIVLAASNAARSGTGAPSSDSEPDDSSR